MENNYFFSNKSFDNYDEDENNNNFLFNNNQKENLLNSYNNEEDNNYNYIYNDINNNNINDNYLNNNEFYNDSLYNTKSNLNIDNSNHLLNNLFQEKENNSLKDISSIGQISQVKLDSESNSNIININNNLNNSNSNNSSSTKDKSHLKPEIKNELIPNEKDKEILTKKRKPRVHLEDLDIDPEIIKDKKYQTIGDKVFLSKTKILTEEDKKEVRAIRNRISAQKSRDKKKAEFNLFQQQIKYLKEQLNQKILIINNYESVCCSQCKTKLKEINDKIINDNNSKEGLILDEEEDNKKKSIIGKIPGLLIGFVCLIGITLCLYQFNFININNSWNKIPLRHLKNFYDKSNITNNNNNDTITEDELFKIYEEPTSTSILNDNYTEINDIKEDNDLLQMCHDKFIFDIFSNIKKKKDLEDKQKQKTGFLVKKTFNNKLDPNSFCFESSTINNGDYIINSNNNNFTNTLPIRRDNIILNEYISNKIISVFIKDYDTLKKFSNGKILSLKEQIEHGVKNSEDGCIYLQLIVPKNEIDNNKNDTCPNNDVKYFEIRCKIISYYNYYDGGV